MSLFDRDVPTRPTCFEQVGWFICHPKKYKRYGLSEYSKFISNVFRSEDLFERIKDDQMVLLFALLIYYQGYNFIPEINEYHPLFAQE